MVGVLTVVVLAAACDPARPEAGTEATPTPPAPRVTPEVVVPQERSRARVHPRVVTTAAGRNRTRVRRAVRDLRAVRVWRRLTRRLVAVDIHFRPGRARAPADGHLADAYWTAVVEPDLVGGLCSISFYPVAIGADRRRSQRLFERGLAPQPARRPPFWAALLAHELAHCLPGEPGEPTARRWEAKALDRLSKS